MNVAECNSYRLDYEEMSFSDLVEAHEQLYAEHPHQNYFNSLAASLFFSVLPERRWHVFEMGGWTGALAEQILDSYVGVKSWTNYEICRSASQSPVCARSKYLAPAMRRHLWDEPRMDQYNVFVASHVLEHLSPRQLPKLLDAIEHVDVVYIDMPFFENTWQDSTSLHVLPMNTCDVGDLLRERGFSRFLCVMAKKSTIEGYRK